MDTDHAVHVSAEDVNSQLLIALETTYPDDTILASELYGVMHGLFNGLRWAVLRKAKEIVGDGELDGPVTSLETTDSFCGEWMGRQELTDCIMNTSGLSSGASALALRTIELTVDGRLDAGPVALDFIGTIARGEEAGYEIELAAELLLQPHLKAIAAR